MRRALLALSLLLAACADAPSAGDAFALAGQRACRHDVLALDDGLHAHLLASDDGGATFSYDPAHPLDVSVEGAFEPASGAFSWTRTYLPRHWRQQEVVEGAGTAYPDGDLDVAYTRAVTLAGRADPVVHDVREQRTGCDVVRVERAPSGAATVEEGVFQGDGYAYTRTRRLQGVVVTTDGQLGWDGVRVEAESWRIDDLEYVAERVDDGQGRVTTTFREVDAGLVREGVVRQRIDGSERRTYTEERATYEATWDYEVDLRGDGAGVVQVTPPQGAPYTCSVTFDGGACELSCPGLAPEGC